MDIAKAVGDVAAGGMVLMTRACVEQLEPAKALKDVSMLCLGCYQLEGASDDQPQMLYLAISRQLIPRLAVFEPLRRLTPVQVPLLQAPIGHATLVSISVVGMALLKEWDEAKAAVAMQTVADVAQRMLFRSWGYLVEVSGAGLCVAAFDDTLRAVAFSLCLIEELKAADWDEELLDHEVCEVVRVAPQVYPSKAPHASGGSGSTALEPKAPARLPNRTKEQDGGAESGGGGARLLRAPSMQVYRRVSCVQESLDISSSGISGQNVLLRGPRLKVGISSGQVATDVSPLTGRMVYTGKAAGLAPLIMSKAQSGTVWCCKATWQAAQPDGAAAVPELAAVSQGMFGFKGFKENVELMQCQLRRQDPPQATPARLLPQHTVALQQR